MYIYIFRYLNVLIKLQHIAHDNLSLQRTREIIKILSLVARTLSAISINFAKG